MELQEFNYSSDNKLLLSKSEIKRFFIKINILEDKDRCWEWLSAKDTNGYSLFKFTNGIQKSAHRIMYEIYKGKITIGLQIDHLCRNKGCVNPNHLEEVTRSENLLRNSNIEHTSKVCKRGHLRNKNNTGFDNRGKRFCLICMGLNPNDMKRGYSKDKNKCARGHDKSGDNVRYKGSYKVCIACEKMTKEEKLNWT